MVKFLQVAVEQRLNILISGGTGSGKTTLLNVLSNFIPETERIVTVEDAAELQLSQPHLVSLEARPANLEGKGMISIRDLVKNCLRMRPERIIVGEVRGGEALDLLKAWNTGHPGGITTLHANSASSALTRLEQLVEEATTALPHALIGEAVDVIVFMSRASGARRVEQALRITGFDGAEYRTEPLAAPFLNIVN